MLAVKKVYTILPFYAWMLRLLSTTALEGSCLCPSHVLVAVEIRCLNQGSTMTKLAFER